MKFSFFLVITAMLAASPGLVLFLSGNGVAQGVAILIFFLDGVAIILGALGISVEKVVWMILGVTLFVFLFSSGYLSFLADFVPLTPVQLNELAVSVLLVEISLVSAMVSSVYGKYVKQWAKAGYDVEEMSSEWNKLGNFSILVVLAVAAFSGVAYFLLNGLPSISIDSITGLIIAVVVCFVIARFLLYQRGEKDEVCPNCHAPVSPESVFCGQCGTRLIQDEVEVLNPLEAPTPARNY